MTRLEAFAHELVTAVGRKVIGEDFLTGEHDDRAEEAYQVAERLIRAFVTEVTTPLPDPAATENKLRAWLEEALLDCAAEQVRKIGPDELRRWFERVRADERQRILYAAGIVP